MAGPNSFTDRELVLAAQEGSNDAFAGLYDRYFDALYDFAARMLRSRQEAADVTHDAFLRALESLDQLRDPDRFKSWLFTITYRLALARIKHSSKVVAVGSSEDAVPERMLSAAETDPLVDPEEAARLDETAQFVWAIAEGLDTRSYAVLDLHVRRGVLTR